MTLPSPSFQLLYRRLATFNQLPLNSSSLVDPNLGFSCFLLECVGLEQKRCAELLTLLYSSESAGANNPQLKKTEVSRLCLAKTKTTT